MIAVDGAYAAWIHPKGDRSRAVSPSIEALLEGQATRLSVLFTLRRIFGPRDAVRLQGALLREARASQRVLSGAIRAGLAAPTDDT